MNTRPRLAAAGVLPAIILALIIPACSGGNGAHPSGTLEATTIDVAPLIAGRVLEVRADEGDKVSRGDTLVVIDTEVMRLERDRTAATQATISAQRAQARTMLKAAEDRLSLAKTTLSRMQALAKQGSATQQRLDEATTQRDAAASDVRSARDQLSLLEAKEKELTASLAVYDRRIRDGVVLAPSDGTVLVKSLEDGEAAAPGALALRIADLDTLDLRVYLEAPDLDLVKLGQKLSVIVDALPDAPIEGTVSWIASESEFTPKNAQTRDARAQLVYAVKLRVDNPDGRLHIGMPAEVVLPGQKEK